MRAIQLTKRELLALIKDAAYALDKIEEAQEVQRRNRERELAVATRWDPSVDGKR